MKSGIFTRAALTRHRIQVAAVPLVLGVLLVSGCSASEPGGGASPTPSDSTASPSPYAGGDPSPSDAATSAPAEDETAGASPEPEASPEPSPEPSGAGSWSPAPEGEEGPTAAPDVIVERASADDDVTFDTGVEVSLGELLTTSVEAETPGEISGSAVVVEVVVTNDSTEAVDLSSAIVSLKAGDVLGIGTTAGSPSPFNGSVAPGESVTASYVFMLDPAKDREVTVSVNYAAGEPVAVFTGRTS